MKINWLGVLAMPFVIMAQTTLAWAGGGDSSGGGSVVRDPRTGHLILLDYFVNSARTSNSRPRAELVFNRTTLRLKSNPGPQAFPTEQPAYTLLSTRLELWKDAAPELVRSVQLAINGMYFFGAQRIQSGGRYFLPPRILTAYPRLKVIPAVFYERSILGGVISEPVWNHLDQLSQAGLLLHEALRHIQIYDERVSLKASISDEVLQEVTAALMLKSPEEVQGIAAMGVISDFIREQAVLSPKQTELRRQKYCADLRFISMALHRGSGAAIASLENYAKTLCEGPPVDPIDLSENHFSFLRRVADDVLANLRSQKEINTYLEIRDAARADYYQILAASFRSGDFQIDQTEKALHDVFN